MFCVIASVSSLFVACMTGVSFTYQFNLRSGKIRNCPCADCIEGLLPRDPRDSRGNPNPTPTDLYVMRLHAEYLDKDIFVWLLCGRHWIHQGCAKKKLPRIFVKESERRDVPTPVLVMWTEG